jgi:hypothetical protein
VHVGAGWLTISALVPDLVRGAGSVSVAVFLGTFPGPTLAHAGVALFFTAGSVVVVDALVETFAAGNWNALVQLLIDCLTHGASAASDAFLGTRFRLNFTAGQTAAAPTLLVHLSSGT